MENRLGINGIQQIALTVSDLPAAVSFYRDRMGLALFFEMPQMAIFGCGDVRLLLGTDRGDPDHPAFIAYYSVGDIEAACRKLASEGVEITSGPVCEHKDENMELWLASLRDPGGHTLALMEERAAR